MRISNPLFFSDQHRFLVYRDFTLSDLEHKIISQLYQPMIGSVATGLFLALYYQIPADRTGYSPLEQQRKLFLTLDLEPGERGRNYFIEQTSKLEAVNLLQSYRKYLPANDEYIFEYVLERPLSVREFFQSEHLALLLRDKLGKVAVLRLKEQFYAEEPEELRQNAGQKENLSMPFYEIFRLNTQVIDLEFEQALSETAVTREADQAPTTVEPRFTYADIITRFPRESRNRIFVEQLQARSDQLAAINYVAHKYELTLLETCRLLDEDDTFSPEGELDIDVMQYRAHLFFKQSKRMEAERNTLAGSRLNAPEPEREAGENQLKPVEMDYYLEIPPIFQGSMDIHQYNFMLRNEPYTKVLERFFPKGKVPDRVLDIFARIDLHYKLNEEVINVLIHYLHIYKESSWTKNYIESIVSDMLGKHVSTYEQAVEYVRTELSKRQQLHSQKPERNAVPRNRSARQKPKPKIPIIQDVPDPQPLSEEELEAMRRRAIMRDQKK